MKLEDAANPRYRLNNFYKIKTKDSRIITFKENAIQRQLNDSNALRKMILKARQFGISTNEILKGFDRAAFNNNTNVCIMAHERDSLEELFAIVKFAYKCLPEELRPILAKGGGSKYEYEFPELNSKIYVDLEVRGGTIHKLHVSEIAFMKDLKRFDATIEAVPIDTGEVTIESTCFGMNHFFDMWTDTNSEYTKFFFPWFFHDKYVIYDTGIMPKDYTKDEKKFIHKALNIYKVRITPAQIAFRRFKYKKETFLQEYPEDDNTCFLSSGNPFFELQAAKDRLLSLKPPIRTFHGANIYAEPRGNRHYVCGADTAEGIGNDNSTASIYCVEDKVQVASYSCDKKPSAFAHALYKLNEHFKTGEMFPLLGVERNNHGHAVLLELKEHLHYPRLYVHDDGRDGWLTSNVTKPIMLNAFKDFLEGTPNAIYDKILLMECLTFINNNGKLEAAQSKKDDNVICNAIALQMLIRDSSNVDWNNVIGSFS